MIRRLWSLATTLTLSVAALVFTSAIGNRLIAQAEAAEHKPAKAPHKPTIAQQNATKLKEINQFLDQGNIIGATEASWRLQTADGRYLYSTEDVPTILGVYSQIQGGIKTYDRLTNMPQQNGRPKAKKASFHSTALDLR